MLCRLRSSIESCSLSGQVVSGHIQPRRVPQESRPRVLHLQRRRPHAPVHRRRGRLEHCGQAPVREPLLRPAVSRLLRREMTRPATRVGPRGMRQAPPAAADWVSYIVQICFMYETESKRLVCPRVLLWPACRETCDRSRLPACIWMQIGSSLTHTKKDETLHIRTKRGLETASELQSAHALLQR